MSGQPAPHPWTRSALWASYDARQAQRQQRRWHALIVLVATIWVAMPLAVYWWQLLLAALAPSIARLHP